MSIQPERRRVLVIDDDIDCADTIAMILRRLGADVCVAYSGASGLDAFSSFAPELIFLDIGMPHMDGYQTVREIRTRALRRPLRVVALTGWGRNEDRERTLAAGFDHHLVKPAEMADLRDLLQG
ncbi:MAG: response regulator [Methylocystis sp.]|uniref:response regulator n=1 Tax=Methylocystis sp. TaxID=1911079 RepID=UPI003DA2FBBA